MRPSDIGKKQFVRQMFSDISPQYDGLNRIMSLNQDQKWRRRVVKALAKEQLIVDLCAGTGDMSLALLEDSAFQGEIVLVDFNRDMLQLAQAKLSKAGFGNRVSYLVADVENLPF